MEIDMSFRQFLDAHPFSVEVEEVAESWLEHGLLGQSGEGLRKFRVNFHMPRSHRRWKFGEFSEDVVYVVAEDAWKAKKLATDWVMARLDPREAHERPRRVPRVNYLRLTDRRHFDTRAKVVGSWRGLADMLEYATERRANPSQFFDAAEVSILADALGGKSRTRYLNGLSVGAKRALAKLIRAVSRNPSQFAGSSELLKSASSVLPALKPAAKSAPAGAGELPPELRGEIPSGPAASPARGPSIYRRKMTRREVGAILGRISTYHDVVREAQRMGYSREDLAGYVQHRYGHEDAAYEEKRRLYADLYRRLRIPSSHPAFGDDHVGSYFQKRGFDWEAYATEVLPSLGLSVVSTPGYNGATRGFDTYQDLDAYTSHVVPWLWDFYKQGPPKRPSVTERYKNALEEMLYGELAERKKGLPVSEPSEEIPF